MSDIVMQFIIEKTVKSICEEHDWNIRVTTESKSHFYSAREEDQFSEKWEETIFRVGFPNTLQAVDLEFYGLYWDHGTSWKGVEISYEMSIPEDAFHRVALITSMTPVFIETIKKGLRLWGEILTRETEEIMRYAKGSKELEDFREQVKAKRAKVDARDPKLAPYYGPISQLECQEFLLANIFPEN